MLEGRKGGGGGDEKLLKENHLSNPSTSNQPTNVRNGNETIRYETKEQTKTRGDMFI